MRKSACLTYYALRFPMAPNSIKPFIPSGLTSRSILLTLLLLPLSSLWLIQQETVRYTFPTWAAPISNVIFIVVVLMFFNGVLEKLFRRRFLNQAEFLMIYFLLSIAACICSDKIGHHLVEFMVHAQWFSTQENEWM